MIGARGGSPTLLEATAEGLALAIGSRAKIDRLEVGVALAEGFAAARADSARDERLATWEPPHCLVPIDESEVAIAAGFPDDDPDALSSWAGKVAQAVLAHGARNARVTGRPAAVTAAVDALTLVGVTVARPREEWTAFDAVLVILRADCGGNSSRDAAARARPSSYFYPFLVISVLGAALLLRLGAASRRAEQPCRE